MVDFKSLVSWTNNNKGQAPATQAHIIEPFLALRREMGQLFDSFFGSEGPVRRWRGAQTRTPHVDIDETDKELVVTAELPGVTDKDVEVNLAGDTLTIKGEKKPKDEENGASKSMQRRYASFARALRLPFEVKDQDVEAKLSNGVLTVRLPKPAPHRIEVKAH